jgi:hypothetical protein
MTPTNLPAQQRIRGFAWACKEAKQWQPNLGVDCHVKLPLLHQDRYQLMPHVPFGLGFCALLDFNGKKSAFFAQIEMALQRHQLLFVSAHLLVQVSHFSLMILDLRPDVLLVLLDLQATLSAQGGCLVQKPNPTCFIFRLLTCSSLVLSVNSRVLQGKTRISVRGQ